LSTIKRASLPGADELFRTTSLPKEDPQEDQSTYQQIPSRHQTAAPQPAKTRPQSTQRFIDKETKLQVPKQGSGRQRHEEKITFYCTQEELLALERARLALREFGVGADRGRIVREALSYTLADLDANGQASILADRLGRRRR
jgi:hypothetical protein